MPLDTFPRIVSKLFLFLSCLKAPSSTSRILPALCSRCWICFSVWTHKPRHGGGIAKWFHQHLDLTCVLSFFFREGSVSQCSQCCLETWHQLILSCDSVIHHTHYWPQRAVSHPCLETSSGVMLLRADDNPENCDFIIFFYISDDDVSEICLYSRSLMVVIPKLAWHLLCFTTLLELCGRK